MATIIDTLIPETPARPVPPLQNGDRLTREEFERRYAATPENVKAELLEGVVYLMSSPVSHDFHGNPHFRFNGWLYTYQTGTPGVEGGDNSTLRLGREDEPQPDGFLRILPAFGGQSQTAEDGYIVGSPELIGEIAATSASIDLGVKWRVYRRRGVKEYVVWRVYDQAIDWFTQNGGQSQALPCDSAGIYRSRVFPGLWLDSKAMIAGDSARVLKVLRGGLRSAEHATFVKSLQQKKGKGE